MQINSVTNQFFVSENNDTGERRYSMGLPKVANSIAMNLHRIALPLVVMIAIDNLSSAEGGPLAYGSCIVGCAAMGPFAAACWSACLVALTLPTP